ncbi:MAG: hypothetical protein PHE17_11215 [Thiothrix sp.]|uniref:hypothetical protein n=1 Tax=Thiothrix sp. TaxID=1032 RepID=UPI00261769DC|nr:hypothetical protein [Thiothrix sp.]MDD5393577.1 hypothetical protein [Thiothrix sp.]
MSVFKPLTWICCCALLLALPGCNDGEKSEPKVEVLETHIQPIALEDDSLQTRYGKLEITRAKADMPPDTLKLDGGQVFREEAFYLSLHQYIQQGKRDLVLFGSNCGGTGCPQNHFYFLVLSKDAKPQTVTLDDFTAYPDDLSAKTDGEKIVLDLGFDKGKHKTAVLEDDALKVVLETVPKTFLGDEKCQWLHTDGLSACVDYHEVDDKCADPQAEFAGYLSRGVAAMADFPGFDAASFNKHCIAACASQQPADYESFAKEVCSK